MKLQKLIESISQQSALIICNNELKERFLEEICKQSSLVDICFKNEREVIDDVLGHYDIRAQYLLAKEEDIILSFAEALLDLSLLVDENSDQSVDKIFKLYQTKVKYASYLKRSPLEEMTYQKRQCYIVGADLLYPTNNFFFHAIKKLEAKGITFTKVTITEKVRDEFVVNKFFDMKEEVASLFNEIALLLKNGTNPHNIILHSYSRDYYSLLLEYSSLFNIDLDIEKNSKLLAYPIYKAVVQIIDKYQKQTMQELIKNITEEEETIIVVAISTLMKFIGFEEPIADYYHLLIDAIKTTIVPKQKYQNIIQVKDVTRYPLTHADHVFFIGCNQNDFPKIYFDDEYLSDEQFEKLGLMSSQTKNQNCEKVLLEVIQAMENCTLSYALFNQRGEKFKSSFLNKINHVEKEINNEEELNLYTHSVFFNTHDYAKRMENMRKYNIVSPVLSLYDKEFKEKNDRKYLFNKSFRIPLDIKREFPKGLRLSYTSLNDFFHCPYRFYLSKILKIKKETNQDNIQIGLLIHHALRKVFEDNVTIKNAIDDFYSKNNIEPDARALFFSTIYEEILGELVKNIETFMDNSEFKIEGLEKNIEAEIFHDKDIAITLNGQIDKILAATIDGVKYAAIIDYKSGSSSLDWNLIEHGLDMQVPLYFYLLNQSSEFDYKFAGGYLHHVMPSSPPSYDPEKSLKAQLTKEFALDGMSLKDKKVLFALNSTFASGVPIKSIKLTSKGEFDGNGKNHLVSEEDFDTIIDIVKMNIIDASTKIINGEFPIAPIRIGSSLDGCVYCAYREVCYFDGISYLDRYKDNLIEKIKEKEV